MSERVLDVIRSRWKTAAPKIESLRESGARQDIVWLVDLIDQQRQRIAELESQIRLLESELRTRGDLRLIDE